MEKFTKRLLSLALVVVMVFSMLPDFSFAVGAQTATQSETTTETSPYEGELNLVDGMAVCPVCQGDPVEWTPLKDITASTGLNKGKHYYLDDSIIDTTTTNEALFKSAWTTSSDLNNSGTICLHLNGHDITTSGRYAFSMSTYGGTMNIMGSGTVSSTNWYGAVYLSSGYATFNIYGGTFVKGDSTGNQPVIRVQTAGDSVNMHGGKIGTKDNTMQHGTAAAVYLNAGSFSLHDGTIYGGTGNSAGSVYVNNGATLTVNGGKITGGKTSTTNCDVYVASGGTLTNNTYVDVIDSVSFANSSYSYSAKCRHCDEAKTWTFMSGALASGVTTGTHYLTTADITSGYAAMELGSDKIVCWSLNGKTVQAGRSIKLYNGDLNIMGAGKVIGIDHTNSSTYALGTITVNWSSNLHLYGGTYVTQNAQPALHVLGSTSAAATIHEGVEFVNEGTGACAVKISKNSPVSFTGANVTGGMVVDTEATTNLVLAGKMKIDQLSLNITGVTLDVSGLATGSDIKLTADDGVFTKALGTPEAAETAAGYFSIYGGSATKAVIANTSNALEVGAKPGAKGGYNDPLDFGGDGKAYCPACDAYVEWTELKDTEATQRTTPNTSNHFYLSGDYTNTYATNYAGSFNVTKNTCLHLNGFTYTHSTTNNTMAGIMNSSGILNIMGTGTITGNSDNSYNAPLTVKGTTNILSSATITKNASATKAPAVHVSGDSAVLNIKGNATIGGENLTYASSSTAALSFRDNATVHMENGTIIGGNSSNTSSYGSAIVWYNAGGTFNMTGGEVRADAAAAGDALIFFGYTGTVSIGAGATLTGDKAMLAYASGAVDLIPNVTVAGTVEGSIDLREGVNMTLTGTPAIGELKLPANPNITATGMTGVKNGGTIKLNTTGTVGTFTDATAAKEWFTLADSLSDYTLAVDGNTLKVAEAQGAETSVTENLDFVAGKAWCPVCKTHGNVWTVVTDGMTISEAGHYYLNSDDITNITVSAASGTVCLHLNGHNITNASGTAINVTGAATLNVMGTGTVSGYSSANGTGAAVNVNVANVVNIYSGTYKKSDTNAVPVVRATSGTLNIDGGLVEDATGADYAIVYVTSGDIIVGASAVLSAADASKKVLNCWNTDAASFTISGQVTGYVMAQGNVYLVGNPVVNYIALNDGRYIDASQMTGGSVCVKSWSTFTTTLTEEKANDLVDNFYLHSEVGSNYEVYVTDDFCLSARLLQGEETDVYEALDFPTETSTNAWCPVCGDYKNWTKLTNTTAKTEIKTDGHYYLPTNVTYSGTDGYAYMAYNGAEVCLHLNGHDLTSTTSGKFAWNASGAGTVLNIMGTGTISGTSGVTYYGGALTTQSGAVVNLRGNVKLTKYASDAVSDTTGPVVCVLSGSAVNMKENVTIGDAGLKYTGTAALTLRNNGGDAVTFTMEGGTINGGSDDSGAYGSAVCFYSAGDTFNMTGGQLVGDPNSADDSTIYAKTAFTMDIGANATVGATGAGKAFDCPWVSNATSMTIAGTVNGSMELTDLTHGVTCPKLVGNVKITELILDGTNKVDATEIGSGAEVGINLSSKKTGKTPHETNIFTSTFTNEDAAKAVAGCFKPMVDGVYYVDENGKPVYSVEVTTASELKVVFSLAKDVDIVWVNETTKSGFCPVCQEIVYWKEAGATSTNWFDDGYHFYIPDGGLNSTVTGNAFNLNQSGGNETGCLHLNGNNLTSAGTALIVSNNNIVNVMGTGTISGSGANYYTGSALQTGGASTIINVYGKVILTKDADNVVAPIIFNYGGTVNIHDDVIIDGRDRTSTLASAMVTLRAADAAFNMYGGTYYAGSVDGTENQYNALHAVEGSTFNMQGGTMYAGTSISGQPNILVSGNTVTIGENAQIYSDSGYVINQWNGTGTLTISGHIDGKVQTSQKTKDRFVLSGTPEITTLNLTTDSATNTHAMVTINGMTGGEIGLSAATPLRDFTFEITSSDAAAIAQYFTYVGETTDNLFIVANGNYLAIAKATFVAIVDGVETPMSPTEALNAAHNNPNVVIQVVEEGGTITLNNHNIVVDMNGFSGTINGTGTVYGIDSITDNFGKVTVGILTVGDGVEVVQDVTSGGNRYLYITHGEGNYSFHRVVIKLTQIVLNTKNSAIYYKAQFQSDETLADRVDNFGINYSLEAMPSTKTPLGTQIPVPMVGEFTGKNNATTSYISDIVAEGSSENSANAERKIYANPYIYLNVDGNGDIVGFDQYAAEATSAKSLNDLLKYYDDAARYEALKNQTFTDAEGNPTNKAEELDKFCDAMDLEGYMVDGEFTKFAYIGTTYVAPAATEDEEEEA